VEAKLPANESERQMTYLQSSPPSRRRLYLTRTVESSDLLSRVATSTTETGRVQRDAGPGIDGVGPIQPGSGARGPEVDGSLAAPGEPVMEHGVEGGGVGGDGVRRRVGAGTG
jgi:hypothetical protein